MSARVVHRPARTSPSAPTAGDWELERPPTMPEGESGARSLLMLVPLLGAGASMTVMMLFRGSSLAAIGALMMLVTLMASGVLVFGQRGRTARLRQQQRERYLEYLERQRIELAQDEHRLTSGARSSDPETLALLSLARAPERLWERRRDDEDYMRIRLGTGEVDARSFQLSGEDNPIQLTDEFMQAELERLEQRFATVRELPVRLDLTVTGNVSVVGDRDFGEHVSRVLLAQVSTLCSPEDASLALVVPPENLDRWSWLQWLPHLADQSRTSASGPVRRVAPDVRELMLLLRQDLRQRLGAAAELRRHLQSTAASTRFPRLVTIVDSIGSHASELPLGDREVSARDLGVSVVHLLSSRLHEPDDVAVRISQEEPGSAVALIETYHRRDLPPRRERVRLDDLSPVEAEALARLLSGIRLAPDSLEHDAERQTMAATALMGIDDVESVDLDRAWEPRPRPVFLRIPIGTDDNGDPVMLDLKEAAHFGMGPHGLCIGATGSGKSELLRTLVLGLLTTHGPADVNLVLVDYKGGATFAPFADAPQVSGVITNLSEDANLVERVYASLEGEVQRRQQLLKDAGNLSDISGYRRMRLERARSGESGEIMEPLPHLLVIIDEFGELLTARPDFIELFLSIGRIGRSIGVHLLLSSQRIEGGKLRGLDTYLSYRIGLRTLSEAESRTVLETPDAFSLPPLPGYGYLKVDTTTYTRFRSGYVSGPLGEEDDEEWPDREPQILPLPRYAHQVEQTAEQGAGGVDENEAYVDDEAIGPTVLDTVVQQLAARPRVTSPVWLPPMPDVLTLDQTVGTPVATNLGLRVRRTRPMSLPIGLLDDPARQRQTLWQLDLDRAGGHVLVIGAPSSGRTTVLRTIAAAVALTHHPEEAVVHALDLLGSNLTGLEDLPHSGGVAVRMEPEVVRRTVEEVTAYLHEREELFRRFGVDDLTTARRLAADGSAPDLSARMLADVVLLIDGYGQLADEFEEIADAVADLVRRGGAYGIHVVATVSRWNEVRLNQQTFFGTRIELRLGDPQESSVASKLSRTLSSDRPGRCLLQSELFAQVALPRIDGSADRATAPAGFADLVARVAAGTSDRAPRVRLLPAVVPPDAVEQVHRSGAVALGLDEADLSTVVLDLDHLDPHLVVIGDSGTGRTALLRHLAMSLIERHTPDELVFAVVDPRRTLKGVIPEDYLGGYASTADLAQKLAAAVSPELRNRMPNSPDDTTGSRPLPRVVLLVDDYDVVTAGSTAPLQALTPYIAMGRELNFHVVLARRTAGAARGVYESTFMAVRDSGATGLMLSGDRGEGQLLGAVRPRRLPRGRALLVRTGESLRTVQIVFRPPSEGEVEGVGFSG